ncbi:hypothetical protein [Streptomyces sp. NPDC007369]|uniref:hypothetical protein n=1 Tax=Streptomyces sp. NPDC007369 TaxID=3154589 RepID=UPI0033DD810A
MTHLSLLASGMAMAALGLTAELAVRTEQSPEELLDGMDQAARDLGDANRDNPVTKVIRAMLHDGGHGARLLRAITAELAAIHGDTPGLRRFADRIGATL